MASYPSGSKRKLPTAAQRRAGKRPRQQESTTTPAAEAGEMLPYAAAAPTVLDVKPINAIPPQLPAPPAGREEPPCLRKHFLLALGLRADLPVHFIDEKRVTSTDLVAQQNRFRIPSDGVERSLCAILTPAELKNANLLGDPTPRSRRKKRLKRQQSGLQGQPQNDAEGEHQGKEIKEPKKKAKVHGGLSVKLVDLAAGAKELLMSRWSSRLGTIVKGCGYLDFIRQCSFKKNDVVEVWAFMERRFRLFGVDVCDDGTCSSSRNTTSSRGAATAPAPPHPRSIHRDGVTVF